MQILAVGWSQSALSCSSSHPGLPETDSRCRWHTHPAPVPAAAGFATVGKSAAAAAEPRPGPGVARSAAELPGVSD